VQYEVDINGRVRRVTVQRAGQRFAVAVDGRTHQVDLARIDTQTMSLIVEPTAEGSGRRTYDVSIVPDAAGLAVWVGAIPVPVTVNGGRRGRRSDAAVHAGSGPERVVAPMPGKVVRVAVKAGEAVHVRQTLVVVEAMKMENELRASRDGTVSELHAREGSSVEAGALLVVIQ
jgi:biotin carboxyl carrier protein